MKILLDTSIWINHFRSSSNVVVQGLSENRVIIHESVIGELWMGNIPKRESTLRDLQRLECLRGPSFSEIVQFVRMHRLFDRGLGWIDAQLLASALLAGAELVTADRALERAWKGLRSA